MADQPDSLYSDLGVQRDATPDEIRKQFRRRARKAHPDKGGRPEEFCALVKAYRVLVDPRQRAEYDRTGAVPSGRDKHSHAETGLIERFIKLLQRPFEHLLHTNLIEEVRAQVRREIDGIKSDRRKAETAAGLFEKVSGRVSRADAEPNLLALAAESMGRKVRQDMAAMDDRLQHLQMVLDASEPYRYAADLAVVMAGIGSWRVDPFSSSSTAG